MTTDQNAPDANARRLAHAKIALDTFLDGFDLEAQEAILRYGLDHVVPKMKSGQAGVASSLVLASESAHSDPTEVTSRQSELQGSEGRYVREDLIAASARARAEARAGFDEAVRVSALEWASEGTDRSMLVAIERRAETYEEACRIGKAPELVAAQGGQQGRIGRVARVHGDHSVDFASSFSASLWAAADAAAFRRMTDGVIRRDAATIIAQNARMSVNYSEAFAASGRDLIGDVMRLDDAEKARSLEKEERKRLQSRSQPEMVAARQDQIQAQLLPLGLRMEESLSALDGDEGHALMSIETGEAIDPPNPVVLRLAEEWSLLAGAATDDSEAVASALASAATAAPHKMTFEVWHNGDDSVGIPGDRASVEVDVGGFEGVERAEYESALRESLASTFGALWDTKVKVATGAELAVGEDAAEASGGRSPGEMPRLDETPLWLQDTPAGAAVRERLEWKFIAKTLADCRVLIEADGSRQSWLDPALNIAKERSKEPAIGAKVTSASVQVGASPRPERAVDVRAEFRHRPGEVLGHGLPDWPEELSTFGERQAYQRGVSDARYVQRLSGLTVRAPTPDFDAVRDKRMSELSPGQQDDALELWLREQVGWMGQYHEQHYHFLFKRLDEARRFDVVSERVAPSANDEAILALARRQWPRPWGIGSTSENAVEFAKTVLAERLKLGLERGVAAESEKRDDPVQTPFVYVPQRWSHAEWDLGSLAVAAQQAPEWGYRDPVEGGFVSDDLPYALAAKVVCAHQASLDPRNQGYVLAFPQANDAQADELITSLRAGGTDVHRVPAVEAAVAMQAVVAWSGAHPDDPEP